MGLARRAGLLQLGLDKMEAGSGAGGQLWHVWEPSWWPTGPRIGSLAGATEGICRGHPVSICLFRCCLQPSPRLVIGQSSPLVLLFGDAALPAACLASISGCCSCKLPCAWAWARALLFDQPRPVFSSSMRSCQQPIPTFAHSHLYILPRVRLTVSDGAYSPAVSRGQRECVRVRSFLLSFAHSLAHSSICCSPATCAVKSRPFSACHSLQSFCYTSCAHFAATNRPILFVCRVLALSRLLPPADPFPCTWGLEAVDRPNRQTRFVDPTRSWSKYCVGLHMQGCHHRQLPFVLCCRGFRCSAVPL